MSESPSQPDTPEAVEAEYAQLEAFNAESVAMGGPRVYDVAKLRQEDAADEARIEAEFAATSFDRALELMDGQNALERRGLERDPSIEKLIDLLLET